MLRTAPLEELAWAAGLFEGEGCISIYTRRDGNVKGRAAGRCIVAMRDEDVIGHFAVVMGMGHLYPMRRPEGQSDLLAWQTTTYEDAQATIAALWRWLGPRRRARAKEVLARGNIPATRGYRGSRLSHCQRGHPFDEANTRIDRANGPHPQRTCRACAHLRYLAKRGESDVIQ